ncbi:unnamed protein product [Absidia cylindrospora]
MLIHRLPPVKAADTWNPRITRYIPLHKVIKPNPQHPQTINPKITVKDLVPYCEITQVYRPTYQVTDTRHPRLWKALMNEEYEWDSLIQSQIDDPKQSKWTTRPPYFTITSLDHWTITIPPHRWVTEPFNLSTYKAKTGQLRRAWLNDQPTDRSLPAPRPSRALPYAIQMTTQEWKIFWRLPITHGSRNVWWRLLIDKLPTQENLRHIRDQDPNPGMCRICDLYIEDPHHMLISCPLKKSFWTAALYLTNNRDINPWAALTFQKKTNKETMISLTDILRTVWAQHWRCIIDNHSWNNTQILRQLRKNLWNKGEHHANDNYRNNYEVEQLAILEHQAEEGDKQLLFFLAKIKSKIQTHINILKARSLSIKGKSIVINSLLLSRLWHIARVTVIPKHWITEINSTIRQYLLPMSPHPSYDFCTNPRAEGGLGIVHTEDQCLALHNIHIKRLIAPDHENPSTGILQVLMRLYTQQQSLVPLFMQPHHYINSCKPVPHLRQLTKLLSQLPPITIAPEWTPRITRYVPLTQALQHANPVGITILKKVNHQSLVQNVKMYNYDSDTYDTTATTLIRPSTVKRALENGDLHWYPLIGCQMNGGSNSDDTPSPLFFNGKSLDHWTLTVMNKMTHKEQEILVYTASSGFLRTYWRQNGYGKRSLPYPRPPYAPPPAWVMSHKQWSIFWHIPIAHSTRTVWWRLLINKLPTKKAMKHYVRNQEHPELCQICQKAVEDNCHLILGCPLKSSFWRAGQVAMSLDVSQPEAIWSHLYLVTSHLQSTYQQRYFGSFRKNPTNCMANALDMCY